MPYADKKKRKEYHRNYMREWQREQAKLLKEAKKLMGIPLDRRYTKKKTQLKTKK